MTRILLIRHGESEWNAEGRWQGQADPPLSDRGRSEALRAARTLAGFRGPVIASPLRRAHETAEIIARELGLGPVETRPELKEIDVGDWSGLTGAEIAQRWPEEYADRSKIAVFPGGESRAAFRERIHRALREIHAAHPTGDVLVVAHSGAVTEMERALDEFPGRGPANLGGRWFELVGDAFGVDGDRILLLAED